MLSRLGRTRLCSIAQPAFRMAWRGYAAANGARRTSEPNTATGKPSSATIGETVDPSTPRTEEPVKPHTGEISEFEEMEELVGLNADAFSGAPPEMRTRVVRIYRPTQTAMSSGKLQSRFWRLDWDIDPKSYRWENNLMGWWSSGDYMQGTRLKFKTAEDAVKFCERQGWDCFVQKENIPEFRCKSYASNFKLNPRKIAHCK